MLYCLGGGACCPCGRPGCPSLVSQGQASTASFSSSSSSPFFPSCCCLASLLSSLSLSSWASRHHQQGNDAVDSQTTKITHNSRRSVFFLFPFCHPRRRPPNTIISLLMVVVPVPRWRSQIDRKVERKKPRQIEEKREEKMQRIRRNRGGIPGERKREKKKEKNSYIFFPDRQLWPSYQFFYGSSYFSWVEYKRGMPE